MNTTKLVAVSRLKMWLSLRNDCAKRPQAYTAETRARARERSRLWAGIVRKEYAYEN